MGDCSRHHRCDVPKHVWRRIYDSLGCSGRLGAAFPQHSVCSFGQFLGFVASPDRASWVIAHKGEIAGVLYLSDFEGKRAYSHFFCLPTETTRSRFRLPVPVAIGRYALAGALWDRKNGEFIVDVLVGVTPATNKPAVKLALRCGGEAVGRIPGMCFSAELGRNVPGVLTHATRDTAAFEWRAY